MSNSNNMNLADFVNMLEVLEQRRRSADAWRARASDATQRSEAWPKLQATLQDQRLKEEEVARRKEKHCLPSLHN